jgi:dihydrofolate reductase
MRKLVYYVGTSIDGYIAGPDGAVDFYPLGEDLAAYISARYPETIPTHGRAHFGIGPDTPNQRFDTLVMGRGTYQPALDVGIASPYAHLRQYVVSTTIPEIADPSVELVRSDPVGLVQRLKKEGGMDIWLCGGGKLASSLLTEIDELIVKNYPVVAGDGIPVFGGRFQPRQFALVDSKTFDDGAIVTTFRPR